MKRNDNGGAVEPIYPDLHLPRAGSEPSKLLFPDGKMYRIEIPSVEGPRVLEAVIDRVAQGSGAMLLTDRDQREMAQLGDSEGIEVCLFVGPRAGFDGMRTSAAAGSAAYGAIRGTEQLRYAVADIERAVDNGIQSFLIADIGLLSLVKARQAEGSLPVGLRWKVSAYLPVTNVVTARLLQDLGASTINIPGDLPIDQLADLRAATTVPLDVYVEAPDGLGGTVRFVELPKIVQALAPVHLKFGLTNAPTPYPYGDHHEAQAIAQVRAKVARARLALDWLQRLAPDTDVAERPS